MAWIHFNKHSTVTYVEASKTGKQLAYLFKSHFKKALHGSTDRKDLGGESRIADSDWLVFILIWVPTKENSLKGFLTDKVSHLYNEREDTMTLWLFVNITGGVDVSKDLPFLHQQQEKCVEFTETWLCII